MKMKVPFFELWNYSEIQDKNYDEQNTANWIDFDKIIAYLSKDFINDFKDIDPRQIGNKIDNLDNELDNYSPINLTGDNFASPKDMLIATKLLVPTLRKCQYFSWNIWWWTHHGIDIMMPKWTPIPSLSEWEVEEVKEWDWETQDGWNVVVVKSETSKFWTVYFCYLHLESIKVKEWDKLQKWDEVWTCGDTWSSSQYHLHLQIDKENARFHPFYSNDSSDLDENTYDPLKVLQEDTEDIEKEVETQDKENNNEDNTKEKTNENNNQENKTVSSEENNEKEKQPESKEVDSSENKEEKNDWEILGRIVDEVENEYEDSDESKVFDDMPSQDEYKNPILALHQNNIIQGHNNKVFPDDNLDRYAFSLILYRIIQEFEIIENPEEWKQKFDDIDESDEEFVEAVKFLSWNNIMTGNENEFMPSKELTWKQLVTILWRLLWDIEDGEGDNRAKPHIEKFEDEWIIPYNWDYKEKSLPRKEVFKLVYIALNSKNII